MTIGHLSCPRIGSFISEYKLTLRSLYPLPANGYTPTIDPTLPRQAMTTGSPQDQV